MSRNGALRQQLYKEIEVLYTDDLVGISAIMSFDENTTYNVSFM